MWGILRVLLKKYRLDFNKEIQSSIICFSSNSKNPIDKVKWRENDVSCFDLISSRRFTIGVLRNEFFILWLKSIFKQKFKLDILLQEWRILLVVQRLRDFDVNEIWLDSFEHNDLSIISQGAERNGTFRWLIQHGAFNLDFPLSSGTCSSSGVVCWDQKWQGYVRIHYPYLRTKVCSLPNEYFSRMMPFLKNYSDINPRIVFICSFLNEKIAAELYDYLNYLKNEYEAEIYIKPHPSGKNLFKLSVFPVQNFIFQRDLDNVIYVFDTSTLGYIMYKRGYNIIQYIPQSRNATKLLLI